jgi:hypothetical protein
MGSPKHALAANICGFGVQTDLTTTPTPQMFEIIW